jgi:flagellar basal-body rod protein FlgG
MNESLYIAATGLQAQQLTIDTIANNLANINTNSFKKAHVNFLELMNTDGGNAVGGTVAAGNPLGIGVSVDSVARDFTPGALAQTNSPMDVAINGSGFFEVTLADGSHAYTRGSTFQLTKDSFLATSAGNVLKPAIHIPANVAAITIGVDGTVSVQATPQAQPTTVGQLELVNFPNASALKEVNSGVFAPTDLSGQPIYGKPGTQGLGSVVQGSLENSNVTMVNEMVSLMIAQRAYEMSSKVAQASDEMMQMANNLRR